MSRRRTPKYEAARQRLGKRLRAIRVAKELTQSALATQLNLSRSQYTAIENGRSLITLNCLLDLANVYNVNVAILVAEFY